MSENFRTGYMLPAPPVLSQRRSRELQVPTRVPRKPNFRDEMMRRATSAPAVGRLESIYLQARRAGLASHARRVLRTER